MTTDRPKRAAHRKLNIKPINNRSKSQLKRTVSFAKLDKVVEYSLEKCTKTSRDVVSKSTKFYYSSPAYKRCLVKDDMFSDFEPIAKRKRLEIRENFLCPPVAPSQNRTTSTPIQPKGLARSASIRLNNVRSSSTASQPHKLARSNSTSRIRRTGMYNDNR
uniref:Uncharacterized protein n=1 Tax=Panagrolaimus sp. ES5 TaxID=591445 RepID=A0AC34GQN7_9BILA